MVMFVLESNFQTLIQMKEEWNTVMNITGLHFVFFMMKKQQSFVNQKVISSTLVSQFYYNNSFVIHYIILSIQGLQYIMMRGTGLQD